MQKKQNFGEKNLDARGKQVLLYKLADICPTLTRQNNGVVGDVARVLGGSLVAPPVEAAQIRRYFGDLKGFGAIDELITIVTRGVPVKAAPPGVGLDRTLQYVNHRSAAEHLPVIWEKLCEDVRRQKFLLIAIKEVSRARNSEPSNFTSGSSRHA